MTKTEKQCHVCKTVKPISEFYTSNGHNDGYQTRCIPCEKVYQKVMRAKYADRQRAYKRRWRAENRERENAKQREYFAKNKEIWTAKASRRRARERNAESFIVSTREWRRMKNGVCVYCGSAENITIDHVIPLSRGGHHGIGNLVPACGSCNFSKNGQTVMEWRMTRIRFGDTLAKNTANQ
jgi:5-methylcytosine-specific restriction endonuclease McrA